MRIYLVRHGQTVGNAAGTHQTKSTPLSEHGKLQASQVAKRFEHTHIDLILASPADRTQDTAKAIADVTHAPLETWDTLLELRTPSEIHNKHWTDPSVKPIHDAVKAHRDERTYHYSDEENDWDFIERLRSVFPTLEQHKEESIVLVSHGYVVRALVGILLFGGSFSPKEFRHLTDTLETRNTGVTIFEFTTERGWQLVTFNDHAHLLE